MEKIKTFTKQYITCPLCENHEWPVDHLFELAKKSKTDRYTWGEWYCDCCGMSIKGYATEAEIFFEPTEKSKQDAIVLLRRGKVFLAVNGNIYSDFEHDHEYHYNEHTCPTNYFRDIEQIFLVEETYIDDDPHGVFEYVKTIPVPVGRSVHDFLKDDIDLMEMINEIIQRSSSN